jgi:hypothetical protein
MKTPVIAAVALVSAPFVALAEGATEEQMARIDEVLAAKSCEVDPENVEVEDGAFDLDDVMCADGQYDIKLDAGFGVTEERKE